MLTDGISQDRVFRPSLALRRSGVNAFVVAIGRRTSRRQLTQIASSSKNVYRTSFARLNYLVRSIKRQVCTGKGRIETLFTFALVIICGTTSYVFKVAEHSFGSF